MRTRRAVSARTSASSRSKALCIRDKCSESAYNRSPTTDAAFAVALGAGDCRHTALVPDAGADGDNGTDVDVDAIEDTGTGNGSGARTGAGTGTGTGAVSGIEFVETD